MLANDKAMPTPEIIEANLAPPPLITVVETAYSTIGA